MTEIYRDPRIELARPRDQLDISKREQTRTITMSQDCTLENYIFFIKTTQGELSKWDKYLQDSELEAH